MKNPYEPPKHKKPKYQEPLIDWVGLCIVLSVVFSSIFLYLFITGVIARWIYSWD